MWASSYSKVFKGLKRETIWQRWADVNTWPDWIPNIEFCKLEKPFVSGNSFRLKPKGSSELVVKLMNVKKDQTFTSCTHFFGATMYDIYEMHQDPQGLRLTITLRITGPLGFLWRKLVAEKREANLPTMLKNLAGVATVPDYKKLSTQGQQNASTDHKPKLHVITSNTKVPNKGTSKSQTKSKLTISTKSLKKTNPLLMSTPEKSTTANRKVESSMFTATQPKLSTPTPKPIAKKPKAKAASSKKAKPKKVSLASKKTKAKVAKPKKTAAAKTTKAKVKKTTAKKATSKTKTAAPKKAKAKSTTKAKKVSAKPKAATKAKSKPKTAKSKTAKAKTKAKA